MRATATFNYADILRRCTCNDVHSGYAAAGLIALKDAARLRPRDQSYQIKPTGTDNGTSSRAGYDARLKPRHAKTTERPTCTQLSLATV
jgi:hypothetical protein